MTQTQNTTDLRIGDCLELMAAIDDGSVDAVVTDPPYGIGFMGREWDSFSPTAVPRRSKSSRRKETTRTGERWESKMGEGSQGGGVPVVYDEGVGAFGDERDWTAFGGPTGRDNRTHTERGGAMHAGRYDHTSRANRGFQAWCETWAAECLRVLKPGGHLVSFGGTRTYHRLAAGVEDAGFEIRDQLAWLFGSGFPKSRSLDGEWDGWGSALKPAFEPILLARKPLHGTVAANVTAQGTGAINVDGCRVEGRAKQPGNKRPSRKLSGRTFGGSKERWDDSAARYKPHETGRWPANVLLDEEAALLLDEQTGGASRFFYCAKVSRQERNAGLAVPSLFTQDGHDRNDHPTVKPIALMRWLCRLVTPPGGLILDPFLGSGTTGIAAALEGFALVGIEREPDYMRIAEARIAYWTARPMEGQP